MNSELSYERIFQLSRWFVKSDLLLARERDTCVCVREKERERERERESFVSVHEVATIAPKD